MGNVRASPIGVQNFVFAANDLGPGFGLRGVRVILSRRGVQEVLGLCSKQLEDIEPEQYPEKIKNAVRHEPVQEPQRALVGCRLQRPYQEA